MASNGHGGARAGAGRKRAEVRVILDSAKDEADRLIAEHLPQAIRNIVTLANGVTVQVTNGDGTALVYTEKPDRAANEYIVNRAMGKPTEKTDADVKVSGSVTINAARDVLRVSGGTGR